MKKGDHIEYWTDYNNGGINIIKGTILSVPSSKPKNRYSGVVVDETHIGVETEKGDRVLVAKYCVYPPHLREQILALSLL